MDALTAVSFLALVAKVMSTVKYLSAGQVRQVLTQVLTWLTGFLVLLLGAQANISEHLQVIGNVALGDLNTWSLLLGGVMLGSTASFAYDFKKAADGTDSAAEPALQIGKKAE